MFLVVGLGNPGRRYQKTRHNLGFIVLDVLAKRWGLEFSEHPAVDALVARGSFSGQQVMLLKPQTYMNLSGLAVGPVLKEAHIPLEKLILVHDDMDLPPGALKIKQGGSSGGHKGVASVIEAAGGQDFLRVKLGIGRPQGGQEAEHYVLARFKPQEKKLIEEAVERAAEALECIITEGPQKAMSIFNQRRPSAS